MILTMMTLILQERTEVEPLTFNTVFGSSARGQLLSILFLLTLPIKLHFRPKLLTCLPTNGETSQLTNQLMITRLSHLFWPPATSSTCQFAPHRKDAIKYRGLFFFVCVGRDSTFHLPVLVFFICVDYFFLKITKLDLVWHKATSMGRPVEIELTTQQ